MYQTFNYSNTLRNTILIKMGEVIPPPADLDTSITAAVYIRSFNALSTKIRIVDIKDDVTLQADLYEASKRLSLKERIPAYTLNQRGWWKPYDCYSGDFVEKGTNSLPLAEWKPSNYDMDSQQFKFPEGSTASDHDITLKRVKVLNRDEWFVQDSVLYTWRFDNRFVRARMTLFKKTGQEEKAIARFHGPHPAFRTGGALSINENEVDFLVALLTCCGMLRKDRQRR